MRLLLMLACLGLAAPAWAATADDAALGEIADALIQKGPDGIAYGTHYYRSLPAMADGKRRVRIYVQPYDREMALVNRNLWYELADARALDATLQQWLLAEYRAEFPQLKFEITADAAEANLYILEARLVPNAHSGKSRPAAAYYQTAGNSMNAKVGTQRCALIHLNSLGNPWLRAAIDGGQEPVVRATLLNELFNGFAVLDFQDLPEAKLSAPTRDWLAAHRDRIDDYTITRSGGPRDDVHLKPLDRLIVEKLFGGI